MKKEKENYLIKYGEELANIHNIPNQLFEYSKQRIINDYPKENDYNIDDEQIIFYIDYLIKNKPDINNNCFIHGDFHYANVLWKNNNISGVLDFEYSGKGFKEQDIAWSLILRPMQSFMDNKSDIQAFLKGYNLKGNYNNKTLKWCLINGYCHFYLMNCSNIKYKEKIIKLLSYVYTEM